MMLRFVASESVFDYFSATRLYLETHGKSVAFYSDKHSIFRVNSKDAAGGDRITQFSRALAELNIDIICANVPQAKGRVAGLWYIARPPRERTAARQHRDRRGGEYLATGVHRRLQRALWPSSIEPQEFARGFAAAG
jgi:hypothetical protein